MRADKIGDEFGVKYIIKGAGDEYQRIDDLKATSERLKALADDTLTRSARVSQEVSTLLSTNDPLEGRITRLDPAGARSCRYTLR